jgi:hypothetical protein
MMNISYLSKAQRSNIISYALLESTIDSLIHHQDEVIGNFTRMEKASIELFGILDRMNEKRLKKSSKIL